MIDRGSAEPQRLGRFLDPGTAGAAPASANPVLQLRRIEGSTWFDGYRRSSDAVWETAIPIGELEAEQRQSPAG